MILVQPHISCHEKEEAGDSFIIVDLCKQQIKEAITTCLNEPLHRMLQDWLEIFKTQSPNESGSGIISEIHAIQKQMAICTMAKEVVHIFCQVILPTLLFQTMLKSSYSGKFKG